MSTKPKRAQAGRCENINNNKIISPENMILPVRKEWTLYRRVSELLLTPKEGWRRMKWKLYHDVQSLEKLTSSWEERLSSLPEGEWAVAESQRGMTQDEVKIVSRGATPQASSSSSLEGEWAVAESQTGMA